MTGVNNIPSLRIGKIEARIPVIQGGMSVGISLSGLASAVANEGGIGVIGAAGIGMFEPDIHTNFKEANQRALRKEIRRARGLTDGIIGVNIMVALSDFDELVMAAVDEGVDLIFAGAGLPIRDSIYNLKEVSERIVPIVSSERACNIIFQYWDKNYGTVPDAVVVEGPLAGGHLGFKKEQINGPRYSLENILLKVITNVRGFEKKFNKKISVIAAGGIYTGKDMYRFMKLGADGVQMATRFVATYECDADEGFKEAYINCKKEDLIIIDSPVGLPGRAIRNRFLEDVAQGIKKPFKCSWKCLRTCDFRKSPYCIALALANAKMGKLDEGFAFAGANAYRVDKIVHVRDLIEDLLKEYEEASEEES